MSELYDLQRPQKRTPAPNKQSSEAAKRAGRMGNAGRKFCDKCLQPVSGAAWKNHPKHCIPFKGGLR